MLLLLLLLQLLVLLLLGRRRRRLFAHPLGAKLELTGGGCHGWMVLRKESSVQSRIRKGSKRASSDEADANAMRVGEK